jgi:hypothetical protein
LDPDAFADVAARYAAARNSSSTERVAASRGWLDAAVDACRAAG